MRKVNELPYCPYKGLLPYSEEDAPFFFGREVERETIINNLFASRLTLLYGAGGVGKSSLLRAGVVRRLRALSDQSIARSQRPEFAVVFFKSWQDPNPVQALTRRIHEALSPQTPGAPPESLALNRILEIAGETHVQLLVILDQFEEYFLYHGRDDREDAFASEFPRAVNHSLLSVNFLVSLREDALAKLDRFKGRIPSLFDNYLRIGHLSLEAARAAIEKPIQQFNFLLPTDQPPVSIERDLVHEVLRQLQTGQISGQDSASSNVVPGSNDVRIEAPLMQMVLTRLWEEELAADSRVLRLQTLERLGGAENIARTHLDRVMSRLPPSDLDIAANVLRYLVTPSGTKIAQEPGALAAWTDLKEEEVQAVLDRLSAPDVRILKTVVEPQRPTLYEISHDVLAMAILDWRARYNRMREMEDLRIFTQQRIAGEHRLRVRRFRQLLLGFASLVLVLGFIAVFAVRQKASAELGAVRERELRRKAEEQLVVTEKNSLEAQRAFNALAEQAREEAARSKSEAQALRTLALRAQKEADAQRQIAERVRQDMQK